mmetsp:Transcript_114431/g.180173  ORF Transcript_114431/g.180173 Transcript_114431/m.180173 type:complete len:132 (+) Transcript_114431:64-459(+)
MVGSSSSPLLINGAEISKPLLSADEDRTQRKSLLNATAIEGKVEQCSMGVNRCRDRSRSRSRSPSWWNERCSPAQEMQAEIATAAPCTPPTRRRGSWMPPDINDAPRRRSSIARRDSCDSPDLCESPFDSP